MQQKHLDVSLKSSATFDSYITGQNSELLDQLTLVADGGQTTPIYMWGQSGVGKSHLLHALCRRSAEADLSVVYIPLALHELTVKYLQSIEQTSCICIDDIQSVANNRQWEEALFHLYNHVLELKQRLVIVGDAPPKVLPIGLEDLRTRLGWGLVFQIHGLNDKEKAQALQLRATQLGFELSDAVVTYLINHCQRDVHSLFDMLNKIDQASLAAQRKITIPFVKECISLLPNGASLT